MAQEETDLPRRENAEDGITTAADALLGIFRGVDHANMGRILERWPPPDTNVDPCDAHDLPVTDWLAEVAENAPEATAEFIRRLVGISDRFRWRQTYSKEDVSQVFLERYGWTLFISSDAPIKSDHLLAGVLLLGPDVEYPVHAHSAEEFYVVLSGTASWKIGDAEWQAKPPGSVIHNPPWQPHGVRTDQGQPLLVGVLWDEQTPVKSQFSGSQPNEEVRT